MDFQNQTKILIMVTMFVLGVHEQIKAQPRMGDLSSEQRSCMEKSLGSPSAGNRPDMSKLQKIMEECGVEPPSGEPPSRRSETEAAICETCAAKQGSAQLDKIKDHAGDIESKARESSDRERLVARVEAMKCPDVQGEITSDDILGELDDKSMELLDKNYKLIDALESAVERKAKKCQKQASKKQQNSQQMMGMNQMSMGGMGGMSMMGGGMGQMNMMGGMSQMNSYNPYMMTNPYMSSYGSMNPYSSSMYGSLNPYSSSMYGSMSMPSMPTYNYSPYSSMYGGSMYSPYQSTQMTSFPNWMMSRPYGQ